MIKKFFMKIAAFLPAKGSSNRIPNKKLILNDVAKGIHTNELVKKYGLF